MKKSYRIIGVMWDRCPIIKAENVFCKIKGECRNYTEEYDLFDKDDYVRKINISDLLSAKNEKDFIKIIDKVKFCSKVVLSLNYIPKTTDEIILEFYSKRVVQMFSCCVKMLENFKVKVLLETCC